MGEQRYSSALDGGEWSASRLLENIPDTHLVGGWVGARAGLDAVAKIRKSFPLREFEPRSSSP